MDRLVWILSRGDWITVNHSEASTSFEECNDINPTEVNNLIDIPHLHEPSILEAVNRRYDNQAIYTYTGRILISVNPFKDLGLYTPEISANYMAGDNTPHIFQMVSQAYKRLLDTGNNQTILVSGESGAGKTHAARAMMRFLAACSGKGSNIEGRVIQSNPILEAFGNAKTLRNDNSSRFGKFIRMLFTRNHLTGAEIDVYLLEKIRVVGQADGERNYHIFYQLLNGLSPREKAEMGLRECQDYKYLTGGWVARDDGVDDNKELAVTMDAFKVMGFPPSTVKDIIAAIAAILHIGNITFTEDGSLMGRVETLKAADLLGVSENLLVRALQVRHLEAGGETFEIKLTLEEASKARDSLSMMIYQELFLFIVRKINLHLRGPGDTFIGILDIFGFESFDKNLFEQFCINYTNESLQEQFNKYVFKQEQLEYESEGIDWTRITFPDNRACLELLEGKRGLIDRIDEECRLPRGNDVSFTSKCIRELDDHPCFSFDRRNRDKHVAIGHYAGNVQYDTTGFCDKSRDLVSQEIASCINSIGFIGCKVGSSSRVKAKTVIVEFRSQLHCLIKVIEMTESHYIRCIKPNDLNVPSRFNRVRVNEQLKYSGILEAVRVARAGYPVRFIHKDFLERYRVVQPDAKSIEEFIPHMAGNGSYDIGRTKIFMKDESYKLLEDHKSVLLCNAAVSIQTRFRCYLSRVRYLVTRKDIIRCQSVVRRWSAWRQVDYLRRNARALLIQNNWRMSRESGKFKRVLSGIVLLQRRFRLRKERCHLGAVIVIQAAARMCQARMRMSLIRGSVVRIQRRVRRFLSKRRTDMERMRRLLENQEHKHREALEQAEQERKLFQDHAEIHLNQRVALARRLEGLLEENRRLKEANANQKCIIA